MKKSDMSTTSLMPRYVSSLVCRLKPVLAFILILATAAGCASGPIETGESSTGLSVAQARAELLANDSLDALETVDVLWGGLIISTQNLTDFTQIEVMGYPLDRRQRPMTRREPEGRFVVRVDGFLEPVNYAEGRSISLLGQLAGDTKGTIGAAEYRYPTVDASNIHLWNENEPYNNPRFTFGIGVNIGL